MKNATAISLHLNHNLFQKPDVRALGSRYAAQLELCYQRTPIWSSLARLVHAHIIASGFHLRGHMLNRLVDIYCKSSNLVCARRLFDEIPEPPIAARTSLIAAYSASGNPKLAFDIFSRTPLGIRDTVFYNAMITAYSHNQDGQSALKLFCDMKRDSFFPDHFTFSTTLGALALIADQERHCQQLHCAVVKSGTGIVTTVLNALVSAYVKCASSPLVSSTSLLATARKLFDEMPERNELSWTIMITGYVRNDALNSARQLVDGVAETVGAAWNAMISGYVHHGLVCEALKLFSKMLLSRIQLDEFTYTTVLSACADAGLLHQGREVHAYILRTQGKPSQRSK